MDVLINYNSKVDTHHFKQNMTYLMDYQVLELVAPYLDNGLSVFGIIEKPLDETYELIRQNSKEILYDNIHVNGLIRLTVSSGDIRESSSRIPSNLNVT